MEEITLFLQLLTIMTFFVILGEPLRSILSKHFNTFKSLNILQICVLNVYLGGLVLYFIAMLPFHLFNSVVAWTLIILSVLFSLVFHEKKLKELVKFVRGMLRGNFSLEIFLSKHVKSIMEYFAVIAIFLLTLWIQIVPLSSFVFGSIHDTSLHSLFVQLILDNQQVPLTMQPYLSEGVLYPQGAHVFFAYFCIIFKYMPPQALFYLTPLFQALTIFGVYYLGKQLHSGELGLSLAFVLFCVSRWPFLITWGANAYIVSFPLKFVLLSFIPFLRVSFNEENRLLFFCFLGILFGYLAAIHLTIYMIVIVTAAVLIFIDVARKEFFCELKNFLTVFGLSLLPISPFIFRFVKWYPYIGHNIGLPSDIVISPWPQVNIFDWLLFSEGISPYQPLVYLTIGFITLAIFTTYKQRKQIAGISTFLKISVCLFSSALGLILLFHVQYVIPSLAIITGEALRPVISLFMSLCFFIGVFNVILYTLLVNGILRRILSRDLRLKTTAILLASLILIIVYSPFLYYTLAENTRYLENTYARFAVTTFDDYKLMLWIKDNLPESSIILVNPYEPGVFIPSISQRKAIYPWTLSRESLFYKNLVKMIKEGIIDNDFYSALRYYGITHIYIGAQYSYRWEENRKWDPEVFLSNPNFKLTKKIGNAYLFEVLHKNPNIVFEDDFEYVNIFDMGWKFNFTEDRLVAGFGYMSTNSSYAYRGTRSLLTTAKKTDGIVYANWIYRKIYLWDTSNVTLSFYVNASAGFSNMDRLNICLYDISWNKTICFTTANSLYTNDTSTIVLPSPAGFFSFNISKLWRQNYNSALPNVLYITIQNVDFDGITNIGHIDNISVRVKS